MGPFCGLRGGTWSRVYVRPAFDGNDVGEADLGCMVRVRFSWDSAVGAAADLHRVFHAARLPAGSGKESQTVFGFRSSGNGGCAVQLSLDLYLSPSASVPG